MTSTTNRPESSLNATDDPSNPPGNPSPANVQASALNPARKSPPRIRRQFTRTRALSLLSVAGGILVWALVDASSQNSLVMVSPWEVVSQAQGQIDNGYFNNLWVSAQELMAGLSIAIAVGVPVGTAMALSPSMTSVLQPWLSAVYAIPTIALAPVIILWLGLGMASKVFIVVLLSIFPIIINTESGVRSTSPELLEMATAFRLSKTTRFRKIYLRSALPSVISGIRMGVATGIIGVVVGELFGSTAGMGYAIIVNTQVFNIAAVYFTVASLSVIGVILASVLKVLEHRAAPWLGKD